MIQYQHNTHTKVYVCVCGYVCVKLTQHYIPLFLKNNSTMSILTILDNTHLFY